VREPAGELGLQALTGQRAGRDAQLGPKVVQVPPQVLHQRGACFDQPLVMGAEQANLQFHPGQAGGRERVDTLTQGRTGDRERVNRI
jgi:hypothetical protein